MAGFTASELLAQKQAEHIITLVEPHQVYLVKIVDSRIRTNYYGGESLRLIFEFLEGKETGKHTSHILTFKNSNGTYGKQFIQLISQLFELSNSDERIDTDELVGKKCLILVEDNPKNKLWQKVASISLFKEN